MTFDWGQYVELANDLGSPHARARASREARQRSSISRAYYGAFHLAGTHLEAIEHIEMPAGGGAHRFVAKQFAIGSHPVRREIGEHLSRLRSLRNRADYEDEMPALQDLVDECLGRTAAVVSALEMLTDRT